MRIYLDNCCYNRPFDDQSQLRVRLETEAKLRIQYLMRTEVVEYAWSKVLDYELGQSPYFDQIDEICDWVDWAAVYVEMEDSIVAQTARRSCAMASNGWMHFTLQAPRRQGATGSLRPTGASLSI